MNQQELQQKALSEAFSQHEKDAFIYLSKAVQAFSKLRQSHPSHMQDFADGIHACQHILGQRVLQREHPYVFATFAENHMGWRQLHPSHIENNRGFAHGVMVKAKEQRVFACDGSSHNPHYDSTKEKK